MKSKKTIYLYISTLVFVLAVIASSSNILAACYTCTGGGASCPDATTCGMTACDPSQDCFLAGALCGTGCFDPPDM